MSVPSTPGKEEITLYNSALENLTLSSIVGNDSANSTADFETSISEEQVNGPKESSVNFILSESGENFEIDPKSKLANKTIFKSDNPNLSIIEINNDPSLKEGEGDVFIVESDEGNDNLRRNRSKNNSHSSKEILNENNTKTANAETEQDDPKPQLDDKEKKVPRTIEIYSTIEEFEANLPPTVSVLTTPYKSKVYLVGTAHFSEESQDDVSFVIRNVRPDIVMVELCASRTHILKYDEKTLLEEAKSMNLAKIRNIIATNGFTNGIFYILLLHMSAQLAKELGMAPGGEFRRAFEEVQKLPGCMLHLGDRPINITLQRALRALSLWQTIKLVWRLTSTESISIEEVEECKQRDLLEKLMKEMAGEFPAFSDVFVKERDMYLCHSLQVAALPHAQPDGRPRPVNVVGVIGIGHVAGITENWGKVDPTRIPAILEIPPVRTSTKVFKYTVKYGLIGLTAYGVFRFLRPRLRGFF